MGQNLSDPNQGQRTPTCQRGTRPEATEKRIVFQERWFQKCHQVSVAFAAEGKGREGREANRTLNREGRVSSGISEPVRIRPGGVPKSSERLKMHESWENDVDPDG